MPPLIVAAIIAGIYFLIPRKQNTTAVVPVSLPFGQNTFGAPAQSVSTNVSQPGPSINTPSTSASGLPNTSLQTQKSAATFQAVPQSGNLFYPYRHTLAPAYTPMPVPPSNVSAGCSGGCSGCSGGCGSKASNGNGSSCGVSKNRASNSGCLIPSRAQLINPSTIPALRQWAANVVSYPGSNAFATFQDFQSTLQNEAPPTSDVSPAVAPIPHVIGKPATPPQPGFIFVP